MPDRATLAERVIKGETGLGWAIGPDRAKTRAALAEVLAALPEEQFAGLMEGHLRIQVTAPPCIATFHVASVRIVVTGVGGGEEIAVRTEVVYLCSLLERLSVSQVRTAVKQALTVALERLAGRSDAEAFQIAGVSGGSESAGGAQRPD